MSLIAYVGIRPGEALALRWGDVRARSVLVSKSVALGEEKVTKTGKERTVPLMKSVIQDLNEWKLASGRPDDDALVFPASGASTGKTMTIATGGSGSSSLRQALVG